MDEQNKLMEQYDEAAFALLMDRSAEEEGAELLRAFRDASAAGEMPDYTDALDRRCLDSIDREFSKRTRRVRFRRFAHAAARAAVVVFAMLGLAGTLIMSVEALRVPVMNFFVKHFDKYSSVSSTDEHQEPMEIDGAGYLWGLLPEEYELVSCTEQPRLKIYMYRNSTDDVVQFVITQTDGTYLVDTEDAICSEVIIGDQKAFLIEEEGYQAIWYDDEYSIVYNFRATGFDRDSFLKLCNSLVAFYQ